jgi:hypothetical protein
VTARSWASSRDVVSVLHFRGPEMSCSTLSLSLESGPYQGDEDGNRSAVSRIKMVGRIIKVCVNVEDSDS